MNLLALNPATLLNALPGNIAQGLIWGVMALGVYITFRLLDVADLTVWEVRGENLEVRGKR